MMISGRAHLAPSKSPSGNLGTGCVGNRFPLSEVTA